MNLVFLYLAGALVATIANVVSQEVVWRLLGGSGLYYSMIAGTGVGLLVKYTWDKRLIFAYRPASPTHDFMTFLLYASMGVATTAIFWAVELAFWYTFQTTIMRYVGGVIGLAIGYWAKYRLDKRFVFRSQP
jgi:putative flippase GtrA